MWYTRFLGIAHFLPHSFSQNLTEKLEQPFYKSPAICYTEYGAREINARASRYLDMQTKKYQVFFSKGTQSYSAGFVYRGLASARHAAQSVLDESDHVMIVGYDEMAHRNFEEKLK